SLVTPVPSAPSRVAGLAKVPQRAYLDLSGATAWYASPVDGRGTYFLHAVCPHCLRFTAYPGANGRPPPPCGHRGVPCRGVVPERRHASGSAVDACHGTTAWARRAERVADGSVVDVPRALAVPPRAPCINAQRVARLGIVSRPNILS